MSTTENWFVRHLVVGPFATNIYLFGCRQSNEAAIIDAGPDAVGLLAIAGEEDVTIKTILQTHAHIDHVAGLADVRKSIDAPILMHKLDMPLYEGVAQQGAMFGLAVEQPPPVDRFLEDADVVEVGAHQAKVIFLPGHSPGHVCFYIESLDLLFGGDLLFAGSIGRVDLPGSDPAAMRASLKQITELPDQTRVLPGHGPETSIGVEKKRNPFLNGQIQI